jgi:hypothetical protein
MKHTSALADTISLFTIVTKSYLAYAKALAVKVEEFHPGARFIIFVVDPDGIGNAASGISAEIRSAADLFDDDTFRLMTGYYTADELCNACKPWAPKWWTVRECCCKPSAAWTQSK